MKSYAQLNQDVQVVNFYKKKENGYFLEIGASDGIHLSNTYLLETHFKWTGICCEPIPERYKQLIINRPKSICSDKVIYDESEKEVVFDIANNFDLLSGISINIDKHKHAVDKNKTTITLKTLSLTDLLDQNMAPTFIEYMSLDTEGSEYEILKTFNFDKYTIGIIDVEHNYVEPRRTDIKKLLLSKGYIYLGQNRWDDKYKHNSV